MTICKSWERQVFENTEAIKELQAGGGSELAEQVSELNQQMARTLKTPLQRPIETILVSIDESNSQANLIIGSGLSIENENTLVATGGGSGGGGWKKAWVMLYDLADTFSLDRGGDPEAPTLIGLETTEGYYTATLTNNAQASSPSAYSTLFYAFGTVCCIKSEDGSCSIIDAATGQTPSNSGGGVTVEYWYLS